MLIAYTSCAHRIQRPEQCEAALVTSQVRELPISSRDVTYPRSARPYEKRRYRDFMGCRCLYSPRSRSLQSSSWPLWADATLFCYSGKDQNLRDLLDTAGVEAMDNNYDAST